MNERPDGAGSPVRPELIADLEPYLVRHVLRDLGTSGIDPENALAGTGVRPGSLGEDDFRLSYTQTSKIIRRSMSLLTARKLGHRPMSNINLASWGETCAALMATANSQELLKCAAEFLPPTTGLVQLRHERSADRIEIVARARFGEDDAASFLVEYAFAAIAQACRFVFDTLCNPVSVTFAFPCASHPLSNSKVLGVPVRYAKPENRLSFSASSVANPHADAFAFNRIRKSLLEKQRHQANSRTHQLEVQIVREFQGRLHAPPTLADLATSMNLSERTLRRRLSSLRLLYSDLLDRERKRYALSLLRSSQHSLCDIAAEIGFADVRSLRRAVKRWTGLSPTDVGQNATPPC